MWICWHLQAVLLLYTQRGLGTVVDSVKKSKILCGILFCEKNVDVMCEINKTSRALWSIMGIQLFDSNYEYAHSPPVHGGLYANKHIYCLSLDYITSCKTGGAVIELREAKEVCLSLI